MTIRRLMSHSAVVLGLVAAGLVAPVTSHAAPIVGDLWAVSETVAQNATIANVPGTTPDVTFSINSPINLSSASGYTVADFLASGGATVLTGSSTALSRLLDTNNIGTLIDFNGMVTVTNGQTFTVTHDDGLTLVIGGLTVINAPGPTAPIITTETYTGPSGNLPFELVYGECCGAPAVLQISLPLQASVPEPASLILLASGLIGIGATLRRRRAA
ncbi:MAG TPA: PEP-CTERM sorting domain-containing protein [Stellaceae bacterium]|nr:PEP-CTERM sorting domain-containing protein [Stellaceae bacterium]